MIKHNGNIAALVQQVLHGITLDSASSRLGPQFSTELMPPKMSDSQGEEARMRTSRAGLPPLRTVVSLPTQDANIVPPAHAPVQRSTSFSLERLPTS